MNRRATYVDASVIAGLILDEISPEAMLTAVDWDATILFSRFGFGEVASAIAARTRALRQTDDEAAAKVAAVHDLLSGWREEVFVSSDLERAIVLVSRASLALKLPDAIHISIAERVGLPLLTADRQQDRAARAIGLPTILLTIKDLR